MWGLWHRGDFHQEIRFYKLCVLVSLPKVSLPHEHTHGAGAGGVPRGLVIADPVEPGRRTLPPRPTVNRIGTEGTAGELPDDGGAAEGARGPTGEDALGLTMLGGWQ